MGFNTHQTRDPDGRWTGSPTARALRTGRHTVATIARDPQVQQVAKRAAVSAAVRYAVRSAPGAVHTRAERNRARWNPTRVDHSAGYTHVPTRTTPFTRPAIGR